MICQTSFYRTTVGKKITMAVTGAVLFLFLVGHLLGNLQVFAGAEKLNAYAAFLKKNAGLVWTVRTVMMACLVLHVVAAWQVVQLNRRARPVAYTSKQNLASTYASRTMQVTGPLVLLYVVYHLMMFTWLKVGPGRDPHDVYGNVVAAFRQPPIALVYIVAMALLGTHLFHGLWSALQTLGINHGKYNRARKLVATGVALAIAGGYILIPAVILAGVVK